MNDRGNDRALEEQRKAHSSTLASALLAASAHAFVLVLLIVFSFA